MSQFPFPSSFSGYHRLLKVIDEEKSQENQWFAREDLDSAILAMIRIQASVMPGVPACKQLLTYVVLQGCLHATGL